MARTEAEHMTKRRILLVDDEDDIREVAQVSLQRLAGWEVITAKSGEECLSITATESFDAILLDVMMPGIDGPSTFGKLQSEESTRSIPVIFLTAKIQPIDLERFADLGAAGVIAKPFDPMTLAEEVSAALLWE